MSASQFDPHHALCPVLTKRNPVQGNFQGYAESDYAADFALAKEAGIDAFVSSGLAPVCCAHDR